MQTSFRQGIISYQTGGFLSLNGSGNVDLLASTKPTTVTIAHQNTNYIYSENNTVNNAWSGPFSASVNYWLYWQFNPVTFERTFGYTTLEPVAQGVEPGAGNVSVITATPGSSSNGSFVVDGYFVLNAGRTFAITGSTANDGTYTTVSTSYSPSTGNTTIVVSETVSSAVGDGEATLDLDSDDLPIKQTGRIWFNTLTNKHYIRQAYGWSEILLVFAAILTNGSTFISPSINGGSNFVGTQIGNNTSSFAGRVLFDSNGNSIQRSDGTFFTTEDQFYSSASRVDGIRLESNVSHAQYTGGSSISKFTAVAYIADGKIRVAEYADVGTTVIGMLLEDLLSGEEGAVVLQGIITNPNWNWPTVGAPLWINNGDLVSTDPHVSDPITYLTGTVPVARVLSSDTVIFEQGLGGIGERGPQGTVETLPAATTTTIGAVTLLTSSSDEDVAYVISDTDPRLTDARTPLSHTHLASEITFVPGAGVDSLSVQDGLVELGTEKLDVAGDTMTGLLTLSGDPTSALHAATKQYVDTADALKLNLSGGILTGALTLSGAPTSALHAATKQYVDDNAGGGNALYLIDTAGYTFVAVGYDSESGLGVDSANNAITLQTGDAGFIDILTSNMTTASTMGTITISGGDNASTGTAGSVLVKGGRGAPNSGNVTIKGGGINVGIVNNGGDVSIYGGDGYNSVSGSVFIKTSTPGGSEATQSGNIQLVTGDSYYGNVGSIKLLSGYHSDASGSAAGVYCIAGGAYHITGGQLQLHAGGSYNGTGGPVSIQSGYGWNGNGGNISIIAGYGYYGNSGNVNIRTDYSDSGQSGSIFIDTGEVYNSNYRTGDVVIRTRSNSNDTSGNIELITDGGYQDGLYGGNLDIIVSQASAPYQAHVRLFRGSNYSADTIPEFRFQTSTKVLADVNKYVAIRAPNSLTSGTNYRLTLPNNDTSLESGSMLVINSTGDMQFQQTPYDIPMEAAGTLNDSDVILRYVVPRSIVIKSTSHVGLAQSAPSGTAATFTVYQSTGAGGLSSLGTIVFNAASQVVSSSSLTTDRAFAAGDVITVVCTTASSIADVSITLKGKLNNV